jgi:hypothetical protein
VVTVEAGRSVVSVGATAAGVGVLSEESSRSSRNDPMLIADKTTPIKSPVMNGGIRERSALTTVSSTGHSAG